MRYFITGANRGLGLEFVKQLLAHDDIEVIATARAPERAQELKELKGKFGDRLRIRSLDINDPASIATLAEVKDPIDVLINNAGRMTSSNKFPDINFDAIMADFQTNIIGTLRVSQMLLDNVARSERKIIVNITSKMGSIADNSSGGSYSYRISKTALNMATRSMAMDLKGQGITVIAMHPGWALTDMGGPNALIDTKTSITGMMSVIDGLSLSDTGAFKEYTGAELPW